VRRAKCEITDEREIIRILNTATIGRIATIGSDGYPYVTPVNFVFHEGAVFFHSALEGEKLDNIARDPRVCFEVDIPLSYLEVSFNPEKNPCRAHQFYHCVVIRGKARVIYDGRLKTQVLNALVGKHEENRDFQPVTEDSSGYARCCVIEVKPERMTAKSDLGQSSQKEYRRFIAERLVKRGLPADLEAIKAMGDETF
jgi:nitroimidazol reductase NimA-like FMN-containing flavoprotein (pyridoxamine 5'-phosphate oxidase superfamily)